MKLYDAGRAPNPRRTRIFLAEKGINVPSEQVDMMAMQHKTPEYTAINPLQRMPTLVLDDGTVITELIAICRYFEALQPQPPLFGVGPEDIALTEMWNRRCELNLMFGVAQVFRHSHPAMKELEVPQVAEWAEANRPRVADFLKILDSQLKSHRFVAGDKFSVADITAMVAVDFMKPAKDPDAGRARQSATLARRGVGAAERPRMIPKSGNRFSDKIMRIKIKKA